MVKLSQLHIFYWTPSEAIVTGMRSVKNVFLKYLQNSQENTCAGVSLLKKLQDSRTGIFLEILQNF